MQFPSEFYAAAHVFDFQAVIPPHSDHLGPILDHQLYLFFLQVLIQNFLLHNVIRPNTTGPGGQGSPSGLLSSPPAAHSLRSATSGSTCDTRRAGR